MSNIKAFTVLEMLVNLTMMSIIMGLIYVAYTSFVQHVMNYQHSIDEQDRLTRSYVQLKIDFYHADKVVKEYQGFKTVPYDMKQIQYKIMDTYLIRKQIDILDTLPIREIKIASVANTITKEELITKIAIQTSLYDEPIMFTVVKEYPPNLTMRL